MARQLKTIPFSRKTLTRIIFVILMLCSALTVLLFTSCPFLLGLKTVDIATILGVEKPVAGRNPVAEIEPNEQFSGTIEWLPAHDRFTTQQVYTALITLVPKEGYTFAGVPGDFFTVEDAVATNSADSPVVTAVFPATGATVNLTGIGPFTGTLSVGETVTAGALTPGGTTAVYQWQASDTAEAGFTNLPGSSNQTTYTIQASEVGKHLRVQAVGTGTTSGTV
jgi:hypothetical protein